MLVDKIPVFMGIIFEKGILFLNAIGIVELSELYKNVCSIQDDKHYPKNGRGMWQGEEVGNWSVYQV